MDESLVIEDIYHDLLQFIGQGTVSTMLQLISLQESKRKSSLNFLFDKPFNKNGHVSFLIMVKITDAEASWQ